MDLVKSTLIDAAFQMARENGIESVVARELGKRLGTSSSPIFTAFKNMEELHKEVRNMAMKEHNISQSYQELIGESGDTVEVCLEVMQKDYVLSREDAEKLFGQIWLHTFGICVLVAGKVCHFTREEISQMLSREFQGALMLIKSGTFKVVPVKHEN